MGELKRLPSFEKARVIELVALQKLITPQQMWEMLGIKRTKYFEMRKAGLLRFSRLGPDGPIVHTQQQYEDFIDYLNSQNRPYVPEVPSKFPCRVNARKYY
jgi:hypothetical protein